MQNRKDESPKKLASAPQPRVAKILHIGTIRDWAGLNPQSTSHVSDLFDLHAADAKSEGLHPGFPSQIKGVSTCYFQGLGVDVVNMHRSGNVFKEHLIGCTYGSSNVAIVPIEDVTLFLEHLDGDVIDLEGHLLGMANAENLKERKEIESSFPRIIFVADNEETDTYIQGYLRNRNCSTTLKTCLPYSAVDVSYSQIINAAHQALYSYSNVFNSDALFKMVHQYFGNLACYRKDNRHLARNRLLAVCNQMPPTNSPTWHDEIKQELNDYVIRKSEKEHKGDQNLFSQTPRGKEIKNLMQLVDVAGQFYDNDEAAQLAYNNVVIAINDVVNRKVFHTSTGTFLAAFGRDTNHLHLFLSRMKEKLPLVEIKKLDRYFRVQV